MISYRNWTGGINACHGQQVIRPTSVGRKRRWEELRERLHGRSEFQLR